MDRRARVRPRPGGALAPRGTRTTTGSTAWTRCQRSASRPGGSLPGPHGPQEDEKPAWSQRVSRWRAILWFPNSKCGCACVRGVFSLKEGVVCRNLAFYYKNFSYLGSQSLSKDEFSFWGLSVQSCLCRNPLACFIVKYSAFAFSHDGDHFWKAKFGFPFFHLKQTF